MTLPDEVRSAWRVEPLNAESELAELRAACRRQSQVIDGLGQRCKTLRRGAIALEAQNAALRAELDRLRGNVVGGALPTTRRRPAPELGEIVLPARLRAAGAARIVLRQWLRGHAPTSVVDDAVLIVSELVGNSLRHADLTSDDVIRLGVELADGRVRIEVEDPSNAGTVAPRRPDLATGGGIGLNVVLALAARWGILRDRRTRVWAELTWSPVKPQSRPGSGVTVERILAPE
jgi:anti-sigma regulatory factor (Ser/Thr protein kinase)